MEYIITTKNITDPTGDSDLNVPAGTVCQVLERNEDFTIVESEGVSFPIESGEYVNVQSVPALLDALKEAAEIIATAKRYFPKSIKNSDRFKLLNIEANSVLPAIRKATE